MTQKPSALPTVGGYYSQFKHAGDLLYIAGQVPRDKQRNVIGETIEEQTVAVLQNVRAVLHEAGCDLEDLAKVNVYLADLAEFEGFNAAYARVMAGSTPPRTTIGCNLRGVKIEIDGVAIRPSATPPVSNP